MVLYRCLLPASTAWSQQDVGRELSTIIPALKRGYQYEFKVRPSSGIQRCQLLLSKPWVPPA